MKGVVDALKKLGLSAEEIADKAGLSVERVRAILDGGLVTSLELRALSHRLRLPMRTFATGKSPSESDAASAVLFRGSLKDTANQGATVEKVAAYVAAALEILPKRDAISAWLAELVPREETYAEAHRLAGAFREIFYPRNAIEPILDLPQVLSMEAETLIGRLEFSRYEGASIIAGNYCFVFVSPRFAARMLFTLAHELGHLIAHHHDAGEVAIFELPTQIGPNSHRRRGEGFVNAFASNLLMPDRGVGLALQEIRESFSINKNAPIGDVELLLLARLFGVSFEVAARRCEDLELLPKGGAKALWEAIKKEHRNPERRADALNLPARAPIKVPRVSTGLLAAITKAVEQGDISVGWAAGAFGVSVGDIYAAHSGG